MKRVILFLTFLFSSIIFSQSKYYTFSELNGMEDQSGNTHLFYRMYYQNTNSSIYEMGNSIYHLDLKSSTDSLFLREGIYQDDHQSTFSYISDYKFWNRNPLKYIYCGSWAGGMDITLHAFIKRFDMSNGITFYNTSFSSSLEISQQKDSLVFADIGSSCISTDGGKSWDTLNSDFHFISINPFNDQVLFGTKIRTSGLFKSTDRGKSFYIVDTTSFDSQKCKMFFYKDDVHIYFLENNRLFVSDKKGETLSWLKIYESNNSIYVSLDSTEDGDIYLADGKNILHSSNYGNSFSIFKKLNHDIVGIYKKPNSNKLYAATKYKLVEISSDSFKILKSLPVNPKTLSFYPLAVGDKWIYDNTYVTIENGGFFAGGDTIIREVTGDTLLENNIKYFVVKDKYLFQNTEFTAYERIDPLSGRVYLYNLKDTSKNHESLLFDLTAELGDTSLVVIPFENKKYFSIHEVDSAFNKLGVKSIMKIFKTVNDNITFSLADTLGIFNFNDPCCSNSYDTGNEYILTGCVINGKAYGDTTVTGIKVHNKIPLQYTLYQNYPNPFNPTTAISYQLSAFSHVSLKVYDVLGREVKTLVDENQAAGGHIIEWNAKNYTSGIYFYRIRAGEFVSTKKMLLIK